MEIVRVVEEIVLSVVSKVLKVLAGEVSYRSSETILKEKLDGLPFSRLYLIVTNKGA